MTPFVFLPTSKFDVAALYRIVALIVFLCIYYAFYFMSFNEGNISGVDSWFHAAKFVALLLILLSFSPYCLSTTIPNLLWGYVIFSGACFISYLIAHFIYKGAGNDLYFNQLIFVPLCILIFQSAVKDPFIKVMNIAVAILLIQLPLCVILDKLGYPLWLNRAYVGGMGNPNSFGVCLILCLVYLWCFNRYGVWEKFIFSSAFIAGGFLTQSLLVACLLGIVPLCLFAFDRKVAQFICREIQVISIYAICFSMDAVPHVTKKILAILNILGLVDYNGILGSIVGREQQLEHAEQLFMKMPFMAMSFFPTHSGGVIYTPADSQYISFALSFGIMAAVAFLGLNLVYLKKASEVEDKHKPFLFTALVVMNFAFLTNRILDYFPMSLFYVLILACIFKYQKRTASTPCVVEAPS